MAKREPLNPNSFSFGAVSDAKIKANSANSDQKESRAPQNDSDGEDGHALKRADSQLLNSDNRESSEQILIPKEREETRPMQNEVKARTLKQRKGKTAKSGREESVPDNRKGRLTFSKNVQGYFIMLHKLNDLVNNEFSTNDEFLVMLMDSYVNNNKELYKKMFNF